MIGLAGGLVAGMGRILRFSMPAEKDFSMPVEKERRKTRASSP